MLRMIICCANSPSTCIARRQVFKVLATHRSAETYMIA